MLELHPSPPSAVGGWHRGRIGALLLGVEDLEDPFCRGQPGQQEVDHRGQHLERLSELPGVLDERLDVADRSSPRDATRSPPITAIDDEVEVADPDHGRLDDAGHELGAEAGFVQLARCSRNAASTSAWRPNVLTMAWPVKDSSTMRVEHARRRPLRA